MPESKSGALTSLAIPLHNLLSVATNSVTPNEFLTYDLINCDSGWRSIALAFHAVAADVFLPQDAGIQCPIPLRQIIAPARDLGDELGSAKISRLGQKLISSNIRVSQQPDSTLAPPVCGHGRRHQTHQQCARLSPCRCDSRRMRHRSGHADPLRLTSINTSSHKQCSH